jgi:succinate dehydrogenase/fumarate reductase flavoprotein subunit
VKEWTGRLEPSYDVVVVGSGSIGLTAALAAAAAGARVAVVEKADFLGGTAAVSGGMVWIAANRYMDDKGATDDTSEALDYLCRVTDGRTSEDVLRALVSTGDEMLGFVADAAGLYFEAMENFPDYHPEWPGAHSGGRSLDARLYDLGALGPLAESIRPDRRPPFTMAEYEKWRSFTSFPWEELEARARRGLVARGRALVAPLVGACARLGVTLIAGAGAERLVRSGDRVTGVELPGGHAIEARYGVILTCGGFEWSPQMVNNFLGGPVSISCSPPHNTGDGIKMALKAGAMLGNMSHAWWGPMVSLPEDITDGQNTGTLLRFERTGPGTIIVNGTGCRFVNEAHNYNDMTRAFHAFDPRSYSFANLPAHLIFDQAHLDAYGFLSHRADRPMPSWLAAADTLELLAVAIGVSAEGLVETVADFNRHARDGQDPRFGRGESAYDRYWGDASAPHPALGPIDKPPFYAVEVLSGVIGTKGGVVTDGSGRVLDPFGDPIPGLFAAGNTTAHPMGPGYPGAGATLGPGMTMGYLAGRSCTDGGSSPVRTRRRSIGALS